MTATRSLVWPRHSASAPHCRSTWEGRRRNARRSLPEGAGREIVEKACSSCHGLQLITSSGYTREGWHRTFSTMVALPKPDADVIADYLAKHFPEKQRVPAVIVPGAVTITNKEWDVPSLGSRPHDPRRMARSGGPGNGPTYSGGSTRKPER